VEQRCKRFDVVEPLAARRSAFVEPLSVLEERLRSLVERLSVLEETRSAFVEQRCRQFDDGGPLAAPLLSCRERRKALEGRRLPRR